jgi:DNA-binding response OmpR family regulator
MQVAWREAGEKAGMVRIAVVNDDTTFLSLVVELLGENGWEAYTLHESKTAFGMIKDDPPDLVILDIRMSSPEDGWAIIELLKLDPATTEIPIIACSAALDDLRSKEEWLRQHNILTLPKPFDLDDLYETVEQALRTSNSGRSAVG